LELWHVEAVGVTMLREPVDNALRQARAALQARTTPEKRDEALKDIEGYSKDLLEKLMPKVISKAKELTQTTVVPILSEKMTEEELRQMIAILESPAKTKFETLIPEMQRALGKKLGEEQGKEIKPQMEELQQRIGKRMREAIDS
jgi:regulator of PEP synthase PpsR (kinase-PPPase family)